MKKTKYHIKITGKVINAEYTQDKPPTLKELNNIRKLTNHKIFITQI